MYNIIIVVQLLIIFYLYLVSKTKLLNSFQSGHFVSWQYIVFVMRERQNDQHTHGSYLLTDPLMSKNENLENK